MQNRTKIIIAVAAVSIFLVLAVIFVMTGKKSNDAQQAGQTKNVNLDKKFENPEVGLAINYPTGLEVAKNNDADFSLRDKGNPQLGIGIKKYERSEKDPSRKDIIAFVESQKANFKKIDSNAKFFNETKFIKSQSNDKEKYPGIGFEVEYELDGKDVKYFMAIIQKGQGFHVFSLSAPKEEYPEKVKIITEMLGTLTLK